MPGAMGRRTMSARAGGIGSTESQSRGIRTRTSSGRTAASPCRPRAGSAVHSIATAPDVNPAPNATITILSPTATRPSLTASASAIGTDAAEVLPYLSRLTNMRSIGRSRPLATASMMRMFAWCGMNRSTSPGAIPALPTAASAVEASVRVANR